MEEYLVKGAAASGKRLSARTVRRITGLVAKLDPETEDAARNGKDKLPEKDTQLKGKETVPEKTVQRKGKGEKKGQVKPRPAAESQEEDKAEKKVTRGQLSLFKK